MYIYHIACPKLKCSAQLMPWSSGYCTMHLIPAKSLTLNEFKIWQSQMYMSNKFNCKIFGSRYYRIFIFKHSFTKVYLIYDI